MKSFITGAIKKSRTSLSILVLLGLSGIFALNYLPKATEPQENFPGATIQNFEDLGSFSNDDSLRIKLYIREVIAKEKKEKQKFKVDVSLNGISKTVSFKNKSMGKHVLKNRPGWATTDAGIWFLDLKYSDFKNLLSE